MGAQLLLGSYVWTRERERKKKESMYMDQNAYPPVGSNIAGQHQIPKFFV